MAVIIKKQVDVTGLAFDPGFQYRAVLIFQMYGDLAAMSKEAAQQQGVPADSSLSSIPPEDIERIPEDEQLRAAVDKGTFTSDPQAPQTVAASVGTLTPRDIPLEQFMQSIFMDRRLTLL